MNQPDTQGFPTDRTPADLDPTFKAQVQRLHQLTVWGRWLVVSLLWVCLAPLCLWGWRYEVSLLRSHFTWTALRYGMYYNPVPAIGLSFCVGMTAAVLVWQSRNILMGIPPEEQRLLEQRVCRIRQQGSSHPLWKWVCKPSVHRT